MSGAHSRNKGARFERAIVHAFQDAGIAAERIPLSGAAGGKFAGDVTAPILGRDRIFECKKRADGFAEIYRWLAANYGVVLSRDRAEPLIAIRLADFVELAIAADRKRLAEAAE